MGNVNRYSGSEWQEVNQIQTGDGSDINAVKRWDGSQWVTVWSPVTVIDDFEDGDISEYGSDTGQFTTQQSVVQHGSYALEQSLTSDSNPTAIRSTAGLDHYLQEDETARVWFRREESGNTNTFEFFQQSDANGENGYKVFVDSGPKLKIAKVVSGTYSELGSSNTASIATSTWNYLEVNPQSNDDISAGWYRSDGTLVASFTVTDTSFSSGGVGFAGKNVNGNAGTNYYDYVGIV